MRANLRWGVGIIGVLALVFLMRANGFFEKRIPPNLSYKQVDNRTHIYNHNQLLAVYNDQGNTFIQFWHEGENLIGGFSSGTPNTNSGGAQKGHSSDYPFGHLDGSGNKPQWLGFWAGFNYMDKRWSGWNGINGNPATLKKFTIDQPDPSKILFHVSTQFNRFWIFQPLFKCQVTYAITPDGIGVKNVITFLDKLKPQWAWDLAGQLLMTQLECDLDPSLPYSPKNQPDLYYSLATNNDVIAIDPFPPYKVPATPSNMYSEKEIPKQALVPMGSGMAILSPMGRPSRSVQLALRIDLKRSTLPPMEYYCEYNGERDYLNYLYSPAIGSNSTVTEIPKGTQWILYGDMIPWKGKDPKTLFKYTMLSDLIP
jgi:hypothetical protein